MCSPGAASHQAQPPESLAHQHAATSALPSGSPQPGNLAKLSSTRPTGLASAAGSSQQGLDGSPDSSTAEAPARSPDMPVVRLFTNTPLSSRLRRPSSPLRTNVTLNIQSSPQPGTKDGAVAAREAPMAGGEQQTEPGAGRAIPGWRSSRGRAAKENRCVTADAAQPAQSSPGRADVPLHASTARPSVWDADQV